MKPKDEKPTASEYGQMIAFLAKHKVKQSDINAAIGKGANGRTRAQITAALIAWLRSK